MGKFNWGGTSSIRPLPLIEQQFYEQEESPCKNGHLWGGVYPTVNSTVHAIQNEAFIGKPCDCGKLKYNEGLCGCSSNIYWRIEMEENL